jgi:hypothetical protein
MDSAVTDENEFEFRLSHCGGDACFEQVQERPASEGAFEWKGEFFRDGLVQYRLQEVPYTYVFRCKLHPEMEYLCRDAVSKHVQTKHIWIKGEWITRPESRTLPTRGVIPQTPKVEKPTLLS